MKKAFALIYLICSFNLSWGQSSNAGSLLDSSHLPKPQTQGRAGSTIAKLSAACQKLMNSPMTSIAMTIAPQFQIATSPVIPFVGFTLGMIQDDSPIMQTCNVVINIDKADTQGIILQTGSYLNQLSANKFDEELNAVDKVLNTSNSIYDFKDGTYRQGALTNSNNHMKLVGVLDATTRVYNKRVQNRNEGLETKAQRRMQIEQVSAAAYRRAIIQESTHCPTPQGNKNHAQLWSGYVPIRQERINEEKGNADYFYESLTRMGTDMITDVNESQSYMNSLNNLRFQGFRYSATPTIYSQEDTEQTSQLDKSGTPKKKPVTKTKKVNTFTVSVNSQALNNFRTKYAKKWKTYIQGELLSAGTFGLLDDKKGRIEAKYRNYAFECSERRLARTLGLAPADPLYQTRVGAAQLECRDRLKIRQNEIESVFENYVNQMINSLQVLYQNQTEVWNFEATKMGYNREVDTIDSAGPAGNYQTTQVSCSDKLEIHEMKQLKVENKKANNELKEAWVKAKVENNMRKEEEAKQNSMAIDSATKRNKSSINQAQDQSGKNISFPISIKPTDRPLGI